MSEAYAAGRVIGGICHGPLGLLKARTYNGDLMVKQGLQKPEGSAGDNVVSGSYGGGTWTLLWTRKLDTGNKDDIVLKAGETYPIGIAIHDDNVTARFHHVSFPLKMSLGKKDGDINAVQIK